MIDEIIKELEEQKTKFVKDAEYYDACGSAESSMQAQSELMGFEKAIDIVKKHANDGWHIVADGDLPKESGHYLVTYHTWSDGNYLPKFDDTFVRRMHYQNSERFIGWNYPTCIDKKAEADEHREVIAWRELPEKYIPK